MKESAHPVRPAGPAAPAGPARSARSARSAQSARAIRPEDTLADLALSRAGASRVFHRHRLDFCCHGDVSLRAACAPRGLAVDELIRELEEEGAAEEQPLERWDEAPLEELVHHVLARYHDRHREELPRLIAMAEKVERVHAAKPSCPVGLAALLVRVQDEMEQHMRKEEQVLFPMVLAGRGDLARMPVQVLEREHEDHGANLERLRALAHDFEPPAEACGTWSALYLGLAELERELMAHIALENHVLFPRALRSR